MTQHSLNRFSFVPDTLRAVDPGRAAASRLKIRRDRIRGLTLIGLALIGLKVTAILSLGANVYAEKVAVYSHTGTPADRVIAWLIEPDAATIAMAQTLRGFGF